MIVHAIDIGKKLVLNRVTPLRAMKECGGVEVQLQSFLAFAVYGVSGQFYDMAALIPGKGAQRIEFCVRH